MTRTRLRPATRGCVVACCVAMATTVSHADEPSPAKRRTAHSFSYSKGDFEAWNTPLQTRDPNSFWARQRVIQKRGIVIEDKDHIVRERYWVLDEAAVGDVVEVIVLKEQARIKVRFPEEKEGWQERGFERRDRQVRHSKATTTIRQSYRGETEAETDTITYSYRIEGVQVDPADCGIVSHDLNGRPVVDFPSAIVGLQRLTAGDRVVRGPDWCDGFADGGDSPVGRLSTDAADFWGEVIRPRDDDGLVDVKWEKTGRLTSHRFDSHGFYDLELLLPVNRDAD